MSLKYICIVCFNMFFWQPFYGQDEIADTAIFTSDIFTQLLDKHSGGSIQLEQPPELGVLVDKSIRINEKEGLNGYRIQIYSGSEQNAREKLNQIIHDFQTNFSDFDATLIYTEYQAPYFKLRVGDFRNKNEAYELFHQVRKIFPNSYIVKSKIKYPKLGTH